MHIYCWKVSQGVYLLKSEENTTVFNKITPNDYMLLEHPVFFTKKINVKFELFNYYLFLLTIDIKGDIGNNLDTDQWYTETKFSMKMFMLDNNRIVGNGNNTNFVEQFL